METVSSLKAQGFTHIECSCQRCRRTVQVPFRMIEKKRAIDDLTLAKLAFRMPCGKCGQRISGYRAWRQEDSPGFKRTYEIR